MKVPFFTRDGGMPLFAKRCISAGIAALAFAFITSPSYAAGSCSLFEHDSVPVKDLTFKSRSGAAGLIGYSEFSNPSPTPKKYRLKTFSGSLESAMYWDECVTERDRRATTMTGSRRYDRVTGVETDTSNVPFYLDNVEQNECLITTLTRTTASNAPSGACGNCGWGWPWKFKALSADQRCELSEEDTEDDAIRRASITVGTSNTAYRTTPANFTFGFCDVEYSGTVVAPCPGEYSLRLNFMVKRRNTSETPKPKSLTRTVKIEAGGQQKIEGKIEVVDRDTDYALVSATLERPCSEKPAGDAALAIGSIKVALALGQTLAGFGAGEVRLDATAMTSAVYTPASLSVVLPASGGVELINDGTGTLRQANAPQVLADVVTLSATAYEVRFYTANEVGSQDPVTKIYALTGAPFVVHKFDNPDLDQTSRLRVTETRGSSSKESVFAYDSGLSRWSLVTGNGARKEVLVESVSGADTTKTVELREANDVVVGKTTKTYRAFAWGSELIQEIRDPAGAADTTSYEFYSNATTDGGAYKHLKQKIDVDGNWERYTYDSTGRRLKTIRPFQNAAVNALESACRVTENTYTTLADADGDSVAEQLTTTVERVLGVETARSYRVEWSKQVILGNDVCRRVSEIQCVAAAAAWNAAANLVTETLFYVDASFQGRERRKVLPDGTATITQYMVDDGGQTTVTVKVGELNWTGEDILDGTSTVTTISAFGQVTGEAVKDILSDYDLSVWVATEFDNLGRPTRLDHTDGTHETRTYACCGLASHRDRWGNVVSYQYDALGQRTHVTRDGITERTAYDAAGRIKSVTRIGTDSSEMVQRSMNYDLTGRLTEQRDALNRATTYAESYNGSTGETTRTTTQPGGGTVIEISARDGAVTSIGGTATAPLAYEYGVESGELYVKEIKLGTAGATTEWVKRYTDFAGRAHKTVFADGAIEQLFFRPGTGQLDRQMDADEVLTLYEYNTKGEQEIEAIDVDGDGMITYDGYDRIRRTERDVWLSNDKVVVSTATSIWRYEEVDYESRETAVEESVDGFRTERWVDVLKTATITVPDGTGGRTVTTTTPEGVKTVQVYAGDRLLSSTLRTAANVQVSSVSYEYDPHHRLQHVIDSRNGTTTYTYFADDQVQTVTTPDPDTTRAGSGYDAQTTMYHYDAAGRLDLVTQPDGTTVNTTYWPTGAIKRTWGSRTYPVEYTYDPQGRVKTLKTWQDFAGNAGAAVTTWNYHASRGWLESKRYHDNTGPAYTYKPSGRLATRVWARTPAVTATYDYTAAGDLESVDYSDATPDVSITYERTGQVQSVSDASGTRSMSYRVTGELIGEVYTAGPFTDLNVERGYDAYARLQSVSLLAGAATLSQTGYAYDAASRLDVVTAGSHTATYAYLPDSFLVGSVTLRAGASTRLTSTRSYDRLQRLGAISSQASGVTAAFDYVYAYNGANQRTRVTREDGDYWNYGYDALGQVISGQKLTAANAVRAGYDFAWAYDDIGNRKTATTNGQVATYTPTLLNTYSQRTVPAAIDVIGAASADATVTVTVNAGTPQATTREGESFYKQVPVSNGSMALNPSLKITGVKNLAGPGGEDVIAEVTRSAYVAQTPEVFSHDADGNLTADARWTYTWDAENRLTGMETAPAAYSVGVARLKLEFSYDFQGRRTAKKVYTYIGSTWNLTSSTLFLYDGWNLVAELDALASNALVRTHAWGTDLSGGFQGAGGVGGLLFTTLASPASTHAAAYDGNGNVIAYVDMATGAKSATYEYGAFGETLIADGALASSLPFRFSTKFTEEQSGLIYYGLRYYSASTGRWINRDPIEEVGGANLLGMVGNDAVNGMDFLGLADCAAERKRYDTHKKAVDNLNNRIANLMQAIERGIRNILNNGKLGRPPLPMHHGDGMTNAESVPGHVDELERYVEALKRARDQLNIQKKWLEAARKDYAECLEQLQEQCQKKSDFYAGMANGAGFGQDVATGVAIGGLTIGGGGLLVIGAGPLLGAGILLGGGLSHAY